METVFRTQGRILRLEGVRRPNGAVWERAIRPPGVRALVTDQHHVLLCRELREETGGWDLRLPGGKVWDRFEDYEPAIGDLQALRDAARAAAARELHEETGLRLAPARFDLFGISACGATVDWDLYVYIATVSPFELSQRAAAVSTAEGEQTEPLILTLGEAWAAALSGEMSEDRAAIWILRFCATRRGTHQSSGGKLFDARPGGGHFEGQS